MSDNYYHQISNTIFSYLMKQISINKQYFYDSTKNKLPQQQHINGYKYSW
jgi:hypothetical protein